MTSYFKTAAEALKSKVPDAEQVKWRTVRKLGYQHDLVDVFYSPMYAGPGGSGYILVIANKEDQKNAAVACGILSRACNDLSLIFVAEKDEHGYLPVGLIKAVDYDAMSDVKPVRNGKDDEIAIVYKGDIEDYVLPSNAIQQAYNKAMGQIFVEAARWVGWGTHYRPNVPTLEKLAAQWGVDISLRADGWHITKR